MNKFFGLVALSVVGSSAHAAIILNAPVYFEDFDNGKLAAGANVFPTTFANAPIPGTSGWEGAKLSGTGTSGMSMLESDGTSNQGALFSYGAVGNAERALGSLASGTNIPGFGVELVNNTGSAITQILVAFTQENWRSSTSSVNTLTFGYQTGAAGLANFLTAGGFLSEANLDLVGPAPVATNGALNGNDPLNQAARSALITFNTPVAVGESIYLRWSDANDVGNDAGLAIDNFEVSAVPEPASLTALGLGAAALLRRRNKKS